MLLPAEVLSLTLSLYTRTFPTKHIFSRQNSWDQKSLSWLPHLLQQKTKLQQQRDGADDQLLRRWKMHNSYLLSNWSEPSRHWRFFSTAKTFFAQLLTLETFHIFCTWNNERGKCWDKQRDWLTFVEIGFDPKHCGIHPSTHASLLPTTNDTFSNDAQ